MSPNPIPWPLEWVHHTAQIEVNQVPFSRSGGRTLGGLERSIRTDVGFWRIAHKGIQLFDEDHRRMWNAIRTEACGMAGSLVIPAWSPDSAPWPSGTYLGNYRTPHDDDAPFSDTSLYDQPGIVIELALAASLGDTSVTLRLVDGISTAHGIRFSYNDALYETGFGYLGDDGLWTARIFPAIRADIPIDSVLVVGRPTCRVRLASDREMDVVMSGNRIDKFDVNFVEDVEYWVDLAS